MIAFTIVWIFLIAAATLPLTRMLQKRRLITWWDYTYPFTGIAAWFPLAMINIGSTVSLSNFVAEEFFISVMSVTIPWVRWFLARFQNKQLQVVLMLLTFLPIVTALVIRLSMPTLPE